MDDGDAARGGRRSFKQRLRFNGIGCCGAAWGFGRTATISVRDDEQLQQPQQQLPNLSQLLILGQANTPNSDSDPDCLGPVHSGSGMNLAAALAAERHFREADEAASAAGPTAPGTPMRVSLMRLLEETETEGCDGGAENNEKAAGVGGCDSVCCVCMGRKKGAAFIPCGHTFCRVCSREVWLNRGSCPLCNRTILEILDIF